MEPFQIEQMQALANNLTLLVTLQMEERDAVTERMAKLAAYFHRNHPDLRPSELENFLNLCSGQPVNRQELERLAQWKQIQPNSLARLDLSSARSAWPSAVPAAVSSAKV